MKSQFSLRPIQALLLALALVPLASHAQEAEKKQEVRKGKILKRSYFFKEADKNISYNLYVSEKYDAEKAAPLVVLLHGLGSNPSQIIRYKGITDEAEERGYILVAPYGYNERGWYGSRGKGKEGSYFGKKSDPENLGELSEKDVNNVLGIVQKEFNIDGDRTYLMGHSMGGGGTIYLGATYPDTWAALAPLSPAAFGKMSILEKMKHIPTMIVTGDKDRLVPVKDVRRWVAKMKELDMEHVYEEIADGNHITSITRNPKMIARVFDFFDKHKRASGKADEKPDVGKKE